MQHVRLGCKVLPVCYQLDNLAPWLVCKPSMDETIHDISAGLYVYAYMMKLYVTTEVHD